MSRDREGCDLTSYFARAPSFVIHLPCSIAMVQSFSRVRLFETPWTAACQAPLSSTISQSSLKFMSIESVTLSNHLILWASLLLLPSTFPSIRVFSNELALCIRWPKYGDSASASVLQMNIQGWFPLGLTGLISLQSRALSRVFSNTRIQNHQFCGSAFFMVHLSHPYVTTGKPTDLTIGTFVGKLMSLFNTLSGFVIAFLPRSKCLLISWLQSGPKVTGGLSVHLP